MYRKADRPQTFDLGSESDHSKDPPSHSPDCLSAKQVVFVLDFKGAFKRLLPTLIPRRGSPAEVATLGECRSQRPM